MRENKALLEAPNKHVAGLDTIRFLAAMWVALGHGAMFPVIAYAPAKAGVWKVIIGLNNSAFNGVAAVMIFFVISGFCIHYAYACGRPFLTVPFLWRRLLRIAIPAVASVALADLIGAQARGALDAVLWSLYYEMIYYFIYPALRVAFLSVGILTCLVCSAMISAILIVVNWGLAYYWEFPFLYGWLVPFPAWLLGCLLAELVAGRTIWPEVRHIWAWRIAGVSYAAFVQAYFFHATVKIGMPALLFPFVIYSFFWLDREIARMRSAGAPPFLEWAGKWSYSIYLMHGIVLVSLEPKISIEPALLWGMKVLAILAASYFFYLIIERPAHQFARVMSYRFAGQPSR